MRYVSAFFFAILKFFLQVPSDARRERDAGYGVSDRGAHHPPPSPPASPPQVSYCLFKVSYCLFKVSYCLFKVSYCLFKRMRAQTCFNAHELGSRRVARFPSLYPPSRGRSNQSSSSHSAEATTYSSSSQVG